MTSRKVIAKPSYKDWVECAHAFRDQITTEDQFRAYLKADGFVPKAIDKMVLYLLSKRQSNEEAEG